MTHLHEVLDRLLARFDDGNSVDVIETGTIRGNGDHDFVGDGWSTLYFAKRGWNVTSIDLDVSSAEAVLKAENLVDDVQLIRGHSLAILDQLCAIGSRFDVALLDSDNDGELIFDEFRLAREMMKPGGIILIDDVEPPGLTFGAKKGSLVVPYLKERGVDYKLEIRDGWRGYRTGVLAVDVDQLEAMQNVVSQA